MLCVSAIIKGKKRETATLFIALTNQLASVHDVVYTQVPLSDTCMAAHVFV